MNDQAKLLREQIKSLRKNQQSLAEKKEAKTLAVISGKGGVGKSNFSLNFSLSLQKRGFRVLLFDMDIGMGNIDILMEITQQHSIVHMFEEGVSLNDIIQQGPDNLSYISGGSGLTNVFQLDEQKRKCFQEQLQSITYQFDYLIFDMGAGVSEDSLQLVLSVEEIFLLTTCEPTSITDAYSALKFINKYDTSIPFFIIMNKVINIKQAAFTTKRMQMVSSQFLAKKLHHLGSIPDDKNVASAVMEQSPFLLKYPTSAASKEIKRITALYLDEDNSTSGLREKSFIKKFFDYLNSVN